MRPRSSSSTPRLNISSESGPQLLDRAAIDASPPRACRRCSCSRRPQLIQAGDVLRRPRARPAHRRCRAPRRVASLRAPALVSNQSSPSAASARRQPARSLRGAPPRAARRSRRSRRARAHTDRRPTCHWLLPSRTTTRSPTAQMLRPDSGMLSRQMACADPRASGGCAAAKPSPGCSARAVRSTIRS